MLQLRLFRLLLTPSLLSLMACGVIAAILLVVGAWSHFMYVPFFDDYFFGPEGLVTMLQRTSDGSSALLGALLSGPFTYNASILLFAAGAGMAVYAILVVAHHFFTDTAHKWLDIFRADPQLKRTVELEIGVRIAVRAIASLSWILYLLFSAKVLLPFCIMMLQVGLSAFGQPDSLLYIGISALFVFIGLHMHVVFLRIITLRPRLFGGPDVYGALF